MNTKTIKTVQALLKEKGLYNGSIDGIAGPLTAAGLSKVNGLNHGWAKNRQMVGFIQLSANDRGIDPGPIDGLWGPRTQAAFDELVYQIENGKPQPLWRPDEIVVPNPHQWPVQHTKKFYDFYGERGSNLISIDLPYEMKLAWQLRTKVKKTSCHKKVADSVVKVLQRVRDIYGLKELQKLRLDLFGGCFNNRPVRNGALWSTHAWGIALDFDPDRNQLRWGRDKALLANPVYDDWWKCWEDEGWISLGRKRNFDWMHVQAARLPE
ncbi:M15 family metallopeptidase [Natronoflexus pectinivorans]|uniref:D-alanyl-D-alanine carboxypeptidase-like protein n=1 Tax=Natronoflexus pectinivorans TaxID=682526 RepID=A0A4R2GIK1_9BACT|nr:M15 family metallopeptidase [Natronoflexus pectinivorans]TCO08040.1 D-alanyl-D-alanine carboxypeptidase-like protein [Natronoflexus pectinivorans]